MIKKNIKTICLPDSEIISADYIENGSLNVQGAESIDGLPPFSRVVIRSKLGAGSLIMTEVWLPDNFCGVFLGLGNGGMGGNICYNTLSQYIKDGYACANTDMGTSRGVESGIDNADVWKDFGWRATHIMTELGKKLLREYYGEKEKYSYFIGASTGGQQAYGEAQHFPNDYDGIIAGVPANNRVFLHTYFLWNHNHLRTQDGKVLFSDTEISQITDCATKFFQSKGDGETGDNFISCPYLGQSTTEDFLNFLKSELPHFTEEQIRGLRAVYNGPVNPKTGEQIYSGMPIGSEIFAGGIADCQNSESPHFYPFIWAFGKDYCGYDFNFADDLEKISRKLSPDLNANSPDLEAFYKNGSKLLAFSGSADPCIPYPDAVQYYNHVSDKMGKEICDSFFKYFVFPGRDHGVTGRGVTCKFGKLLHVLRAWCEKGEAPDYLTAVRYENDEAVFERKIYPYNADKVSPDTLQPVCCEEYLKHR